MVQPNALYYGDCLDWMERWDDQSVDLIYLDPPFNSNTNYNILYSTAGGGQAQVRAFDDTWHWDAAAAKRYAMYERAARRPAHRVIVGLYHVLGESGMLAYLTYMAERLEQMYRLLKPTGSLYFHCDSTVSHHIKLVLDAIFGAGNFRNEIVWRRFNFHADARRFGRVSDTLLFYSKSSTYNFNRQRAPFSKEYVRTKFTHVDGKGRRFRLSDLNPPAGRGPVYEFHGITKPWRFTKAKMQELDRQGRIYHKSKIAQLKRYLDELDGQAVHNVWTDIPPINSQAKERLGYPTQKPLQLLERIIRASSNKGDIVLDPFCGCGTTVDAARRLGRQFVGVDISSFAIDLIIERRLLDSTIPVYGIPVDLASARKLARDKPFRFESWAVERLPGFQPNSQQIGDGGIDGWGNLYYEPEEYTRQAIAQVKGGKFNLSQLRDFLYVTNDKQAALGCYVTLEPVKTPAALRAAASAGTVAVEGQEYPRMQLWPISDHFEGKLPPLPIMADLFTGKPVQPVLR